MPTVALHSRYWQTQAAAGGAASQLATYPLWQTTVIVHGSAALVVACLLIPAMVHGASKLGA